MYKDNEIEQLDTDWFNFREYELYYAKDNDTYQALMVRTFPILYKKWKENEKVVDKDIAQLVCTIGNLFDRVFDDDGNCMTCEACEVAAFFHHDFLIALMYDESLTVNEDGTITVPGDGVTWTVDPKTFELPDDIPFDDRDE